MAEQAPASAPVVACPHCQTPVPWSAASPWRPFCSERCKLIDLGAWADESHRIPGEASLPNGEPYYHEE